MTQIPPGYKDEDRASCFSKQSPSINRQMSLASLDTGCFDFLRVIEMCGRQPQPSRLLYSGTLHRQLYLPKPLQVLCLQIDKYWLKIQLHFRW